MTTLGAALVDLNPPHAPGRAGVVSGVAPLGGLAVGALGCGALVQFAPAPTHLVFILLLAGMVVSAVFVALMPETAVRRPGGLASLKPKLGIPQRLRPDVLALVPILVASWALGGLYLSLGPSVAASIFGLTNHLVGGLVVTLLCATGAVTAFALKSWPTGRVLGIAAVLLTGGTAITLLGIVVESIALAAVGTAIAGIGFGASALACFGTLARLAAPRGARRALRRRVRHLLPRLQPAGGDRRFRRNHLRAAQHRRGVRPGRRAAGRDHPGDATPSRSPSTVSR